MTTQQRRAAQATTNGHVDTDSIEYKVDALIWLLAEEQLRTIRLAQALASLLAQAAAPQITAGIMGQLLNTETPIQGAPPVLPGQMMPPGA